MWLSIVPMLLTLSQSVDTLGRLACSEAGPYQPEAKRVMRVLYNRSILYKSPVLVEAKKPYQFALTRCKRKDLKPFHFSLAMKTLLGSIKAPDKVLNKGRVTHFAATWALAKQHPRCKGYTTQEVWEYNGLEPVLTTEVKHVFFKKKKGKSPSGCPSRRGSNGK